MTKGKSLVALLGLVLPGIGLAADGVAVQHSEPLFAYRVAARSDAAAKPLADSAPEITFNAFGRDFALRLEPNPRLAGLEAGLGLPPGVRAYRGELAGRPGSWARVVLTPDGPAGIVYDGETFYGLETAGDTATSSATPTIFRLLDVYVAPGALSCGTDAPADGARALAALVEELSPLAALGATLNLDIGAVADFEFAQNFGAGAETALLTRINNVDGIFSQQVGVQITVGETAIFTANDDPFTATAADGLLTALADYRFATPGQRAQGLTHLFTGRDLDGSTAGIAYVGALCSARFGSGLSEARRGATIDSLIAAHEIGHNFGAPHDAEAGSACQSTPATFLMAPAINQSNQFSACSIAQMQAEIASASCLTPLAAASVSVTTTPTARATPAGIAFEQTFNVTNQGSNAATGVTVAVAVAAGLDVMGATSGGGACTVAGQMANCTLGALNGSAAQTVVLNLRASQVGSLVATATVTADEDANPNDNSATVTVTATPLVDLVLTATPGSVAPNEQTTVAATLENAGDFTATAVALSATLSAGVRPDQASIGGTACTIAGQTITCPPRTLAAHGTVAVTLTVTGVTAGSQQIALTATAAETERASTNNQLAVTVTVNAPAAAESDGGGGSSSWWWVALLGAAGWSRRRGKTAAA
jgi:hypothetical protein